ncbi:hypothetical protein KJ359_010652 [Pestalotiopsis sp. 9143b]|nr:hypothetical protein KJ359_010652 [Pestalotiopsis sp. 9143b]
MRLIDTQTHLLLEPWKAAGKEYAILSHTWGDQEVIFQEWEQLFPSGAIKGQCPHVRHDGIDKKAGYHKVVQACEQARRDGIRYLWCDTMCINKESSAELSEAINSMFKWYRDAKVCYVYLTDVTFPSKKTRHGLVPTQSNFPGWFPYAMERKQDDDFSEMKARFMASRWWTRGWTLQELLAPKNVAFFTLDWMLLGHKSGIAPWISSRTRIHREALEDATTISNFSIAQRMSWAASRTTTVVEDMAYCLLGIFDINMPMLYGQGEGAFQKLQHEIIKASGDQSIFAWTIEDGDSHPWTGALARSPNSFKNCGSIVRNPEFKQEPSSRTNVGFKMRVGMINNAFMTQSYIGLGCFLELHGESHSRGSVNKTRRRVPIWIPVRRRGYGGDSYERVHLPTSHVFFQSSYPTTKVLESHKVFLCEFPYSPDGARAVDGPFANETSRTGITVAVGFGNMSMISGAYKDPWQPRGFKLNPIGQRGPHRLSHMNLPKLLDELRQADKVPRQLNDANSVHQRIRSNHHTAAAAGQSKEAPMIVVEDESLYDVHGSAFVMVDIIFKEKRIAGGDREQARQDVLHS